MNSDEVEKRVTQTELTELKAALRQLQGRVDRHALVIQVLKDMLLSQSEPSEDAFLERLEHAATRKAEEKNCRKCGKPMSTKHTRCMYCGAERPPELL